MTTGDERIAALDARFVEIYEATRKRLLDRQKERALILVNEDYMLLYHRGRAPQVVTGLRPPLYDKLKTSSHVPLAIYCLLIDHAELGADLPPDIVQALRDYREELARTANDLDTTQDSKDGLLPRRVGIAERAAAFLDRTIGEGRVSPDDFRDFCRGIIADINAGFAASTKVQLDTCHRHMMRLKEEVLSPEEWASLHVVIMGPHMAHRDNNILQYFSRLLHTPKYADQRVVYYEGDDVDGAFALMGTAILDRQASHQIFENDARLHRDVLADATKTYLDELLPE